MNMITTTLPDVMILEPAIHQDHRGYFYESFNQRAFQLITGIDLKFVQDNCCRSRKNVLRGLHYQLTPNAQGKLIRVGRGSIFDVAVDLRKQSLTFGQWVSCILSEENNRQLWIPPGFAHGYLVLSDIADVFYKTTSYYAPEKACCIRWDDLNIGICWPLQSPPILSPQDERGDSLQSAVVYDEVSYLP